jgi:hypothetical protein
MTDIRSSALGYIRDGRVRIEWAATPVGGWRPTYVLAKVGGFHGTYTITFDANVWTCTCGADLCPHAAAIALLTGWPSPAAKPAKQKA